MKNNKLWLISLSLILLPFTKAGAQKSYVIQFGSDGRMIKALPEKAPLPGDTILFEVSATGNHIKEKISPIVSKLSEAYNKLKDTAYQRQLRDTFGINNANDIRAEIGQWINRLKPLMSEDQKINLPADLPAAGPPAASVYLPDFDAFINSLYSIDIYNETDDFYVSSSASDQFSLQYDEKNKQFSATYTIPQGSARLRSQLRLNDPLYKMVSDWFMKTFTSDMESIKAKDRNDLLQMRKIFDTLAKYNKWLSDQIQNNSPNALLECGLIEKKVADNNDSIKLLDNLKATFLKDFKSHYVKLISSWLWYNDGEITTNPFYVTTPTQTPDSGKINKKIVDSIQLLSYQAEAYNDLLNNKSLTFSDQSKIVSFTREIALLKQKLSQITAMQADLKKGNLSLSKAQQALFPVAKSQSTAPKCTKDELLYDGSIYIGKINYIFTIIPYAKSNTFVIHHNANKDFQLINEKVQRRYPENDKVFVLVENSDGGAHFDETSAPAAESSVTTVFGNNFINAVSGSSSFAELIKSPLTKGKISTDAAKTSLVSLKRMKIIHNYMLENDIRDESADKCDSNRNVFNLQMKSLESFLPFFTYYAPFLIETVKPASLSSSTDTVWRTQVFTPTDTVTPGSKVTYRLGFKKDDLFYKRSFTYDKRYRYMPAAGVLYSWSKINEVKDNGGSLDGYFHGGLRPAVGIKIYFKPEWLCDPYFIISGKRNPNISPKTHLFIGFDPIHPARDWFSGLGIEFFSGLEANAGFHWIRSTQYQYESNVEIGHHDFMSISPYIGVNVDPGLIINIFSFIGTHLF